jgi:hypothetical protein
VSVALGKGPENVLASMRQYRSHDGTFNAQTRRGSTARIGLCLKKDEVLSVPSLQWRRRLQCQEVGDGWVAGPVSGSVRAVGDRCVGIPALDQPPPGRHPGQRDAATMRRYSRRRIARQHWVVDRRPEKFLVGLAPPSPAGCWLPQAGLSALPRLRPCIGPFPTARG